MGFNSGFKGLKSCVSVVLTFDCSLHIHITEGTVMIFKVVHLCLKNNDFIMDGSQGFDVLQRTYS